MSDFTAQDIFVQANVFLHIVTDLFQERKNITMDGMKNGELPRDSLFSQPEILRPIAVNGSLACELYFKALLRNKGYSLAQIKKFNHNLQNLYNEFSTLYENDLPKEMNMDEFKFNRELDLIKDVFMTWRYYYEPLKEGEVDETISFDFIINLANTLKTICTNELPK